MLRRLVRAARRFASPPPRKVLLPPWDPAHPRPLVSSAQPGWLAEIARKGAQHPFRTLPSPAELWDERQPTVELAGLLGDLRLPALAARDRSPIPADEDREGYAPGDHLGWWLNGLRDYLMIRLALKARGAPLVPGDALFELGASSGRVLRHFACQEEGLETWGSDINLRSVEWMRTFLPHSVRPFQNTGLPHLPLEDRSMAAVFAFSVFTHIDELETAWLLELRRILRPGGRAFVTINSDWIWQQMQPSWSIRRALLELAPHIQDFEVTEKLLAGPLPAPRTVFWWGLRVYHCNVFQSHDYVRSAWGRFLEVEEIIKGAEDRQDLVSLRR